MERETSGSGVSLFRDDSLGASCVRPAHARVRARDGRVRRGEDEKRKINISFRYDKRSPEHKLGISMPETRVVN